MSNEEIVKRIQQGVNPSDNMEALYMNNKPYIHQIAKKYSNYVDVEDLMQEAYFGLYEAVQRYEDTQETKFITYASFWIQQSIHRYIENTGNVVRIPSHLKEKVSKYKKIINAFTSQLGRKPTDRELAAHLNISFKQLESIKGAINAYGTIKSLDTPIQGAEDVLLSDTIPDKADIENGVIDEMMREKINMELWELVKDNTEPEENEVICLRYQDNMTLEEIGAAIGKSRDKARAIESKALRKLRQSKVRREIENRFEINYARSYRGSVTSFRNNWTSITEDVAIRNLEIEKIRQ